MGQSQLNSLRMSKDGVEALKKHEAVIKGIYNDPSGYATFGVGHLLQKFPSVLLHAAKSEKICDSHIAQQSPGKRNERTYLDRGVLRSSDFSKLKSKAAEQGPEIVAQAKYKRPLRQLSDNERAIVRGLADGAVREESRLIARPIDTVLREDLKRFENAVNQGVTAAALTQGEFDSLPRPR
jgi:hypothetical protein